MDKPVNQHEQIIPPPPSIPDRPPPAKTTAQHTELSGGPTSFDLDAASRINSIEHPERIFADGFEQIRIRNIRNMLDRAKIPDEFYTYSIQPNEKSKQYIYVDSRNVPIPSRKYAYDSVIKYIAPENIINNVSTGKCVFINGKKNSNLGITLLCTFLLRACIEAGYSGEYISFTNLCDEMFHANDETSETNFFSKPIILIDGINTSPVTMKDALKGRLSSLFKYRADKKLPIFFASHVPYEEFIGGIDSSLMYSYNPVTINLEIKSNLDRAPENVHLESFIKTLHQRYKKPLLSKDEILSALEDFCRRNPNK